MMRCPVVPTHHLREVAPDLWQCPDCGAGPGLYCAFSRVEIEDGIVGARCTTWKQDLDIYVVTAVFWDIDDDGARIPNTFSSYVMGYLSTGTELRTGALPVINPSGERCRLRAGMYSEALGRKTYPRGALSGKSGARRTPVQSRARSPARQKTSAKKTTS